MRSWPERARPRRITASLRERPLSLRFRQETRERARLARRQALIVLPLIAIVVLGFVYREELFGLDAPVRIASAIALAALGWAFARAAGRAVAPVLFRHFDRGNAGTIGFLIRLVTMGAIVLAALRMAGLRPGTLAVGGAVTAVVLGLAAQQTLGNLFAGVVLLTAQPFSVGDRVFLQGGGLGGEMEGECTGLGLLYTEFSRGKDTILVPNNVVLTSAVVPLREPTAVELRARLQPGVKPSDVQAVLDGAVTVPTRANPHIGLEEVDSDKVVVRISATPESHEDGWRLADEILDAIDGVTRLESAAWDGGAEAGADEEAGDDRTAGNGGAQRAGDGPRERGDGGAPGEPERRESERGEPEPDGPEPEPEPEPEPDDDARHALRTTGTGRYPG